MGVSRKYSDMFFGVKVLIMCKTVVDIIISVTDIYYTDTASISSEMMISIVDNRILCR